MLMHQNALDPLLMPNGFAKLFGHAPARRSGGRRQTTTRQVWWHVMLFANFRAGGCPNSFAIYVGSPGREGRNGRWLAAAQARTAGISSQDTDCRLFRFSEWPFRHVDELAYAEIGIIEGLDTLRLVEAVLP